MSRASQQAKDLVVASNFIRAIRDAGYLSMSTALAELVDNSLQASASEVAISIRRLGPGRFPEITIEDNGAGMTKSELEQCLKFGGSSRFEARQSFGRFGMGLPAASLSQTRQIEVDAWQNAGCQWTVTLDVDAIVAGSDNVLVARQGPKAASKSGCRVKWTECDRIEYQRLAWLERLLHRDLGRTFRRFLAEGFRLTINGKSVKAIDPTLLTTKIEGVTAQLAFSELTYELETDRGGTSSVTVRFVMLPVHRWHTLDNATKRRVGIVGGAGISVLRAGREITNGWHLMGGKRRENYDDWWRCEIEFDPHLDEHFGITINKQDIRPSAQLREALEPELEAIARILNTRIRRAFEDLKFQAAAEKSCQIATAADQDLPVIGTRGTGAIQYRIGSAPLPLTAMFRSALAQRTIDLTFNTDHPAFKALYQPLQGLDESTAADLRTAIELLLLSFARSSAELEMSGHHLEDLLHAWSSTYGRMLQKS